MCIQTHMPVDCVSPDFNRVSPSKPRNIDRPPSSCKADEMQSQDSNPDSLIPIPELLLSQLPTWGTPQLRW